MRTNQIYLELKFTDYNFNSSKFNVCLKLISILKLNTLRKYLFDGLEWLNRLEHMFEINTFI